VQLDETAAQVVEKFHGKLMYLISHSPGLHDYKLCAQRAREQHFLDTTEAPDLIFLEISVSDASDFAEDTIHLKAFQEDGFVIFRCASAAVPNAIASILIALRNKTGAVPHAFMYWTEGNPLFYVLRYLLLGDGETAPVTREILREAEPDLKRRPKIHVV
jgi:hypothetical protein